MYRFRTNLKAQPKRPFYKSPTLRLSLSLSTILLLYRLLFRFFTRLRAHLLNQSALPFRQRNPRTADTLTSPYAPAVGASLAGLALGVYPAQQLRVSVAIYAAFRALEFGWNCAEDGGMVWGWVNGRKRARPWWWGSWMLQPFAFGQLLHAVVFDRDCFPTVIHYPPYMPTLRTLTWATQAYGDFIFRNSTAYIHTKPKDFPSNIRWPNTYQVVDSLAQMARLNWPFVTHDHPRETRNHDLLTYGKQTFHLPNLVSQQGRRSSAVPGRHCAPDVWRPSTNHVALLRDAPPV